MGMKSRITVKQKQAIEDARELIARWNDGEVDNAAESLQESHEILEDLPSSEAELREQLEEIRDESTKIMVDVYG